MDCIFCQIVAGKIPTEILYQDDSLMVFRDIHPHAPIHLLVIPKKHIPSLAVITEAESPLIAHMVMVGNKMAKREGVLESGYRVVINSGKEGGQVVPHLHMHVLGGRRLPDALA